MNEKDVAYLISLRDQFSAKLNAIHKNVEGFDRTMGGLGNTIKKMSGLLAGAFSVYGVFEFLKGSKEAFEQLESATSRMNQELLTTGHAAGLSGKELEDYAKSMSKTVLNSRSEIIEAQTQLLRFTNIGGEMFKKAMPLIADYATFTKTSLSGAVDKVGMALGGSQRGLMMLQREFGKINPVQEEHLKNLLKQNKLYEYQNELLKLLQSRVGGQAKAATLTDAGKIAMAKKNWEDIRLGFGKMISDLTIKLIPAFNKLFDIIRSAMPTIKAIFEAIGTGLTTFIDLVSRLLPLIKILVEMFIAWKVAMVFNFLIEGAISLYNSLSKLPALVSALGAGFQTWALPILTAVAAVMALNMAMEMRNFHKTMEGYAKTVTEINEKIKGLEAEDTDEADKQIEVLENLRMAYAEKAQALQEMAGGNYAEVIKKGFVRQVKGIMDAVTSAMPKALKIPALEKYSSTFQGGNISQDNITKIESAAPKVFNTNIQKMIGVETLQTNTVNDSLNNIGQAMLQELVGVLNDSQITANI